MLSGRRVGVAPLPGILKAEPFTRLQPMDAPARTGSRRSGDWAEQRALRLLRGRGWRLLERNWPCRWGELDLVLAKGDRLLLVEVKGRRGGGRDGRGCAALRRDKRTRLRRAWACWLAAHPEHGEARVEWVAALVPLPPSSAPVRWLRLWA